MPLALLAALRQLLQLGGGRGVGPVAQRPKARFVAVGVRGGNRRLDDLQGRGPAHPPQRGQEGRLIVFRKLGQGGQQGLGPLGRVLVPVTDDHDGLFRRLAFRARPGFQHAPEHLGNLLGGGQLGKRRHGGHPHLGLRILGGRQNAGHAILGIAGGQHREQFHAEGRIGRRLQFGHDGRIDRRTTQLDETRLGGRGLRFGSRSPMHQHRHVGRTAQGAQGFDGRRADLGFLALQHFQNGRPGGHVAPSGQGREQSGLDRGRKRGQQGRKPAA